MAAPANDTYTGRSGYAIACGRYHWPLWRRAMESGTVAQVGSNCIHDIDPALDPDINPNYPSTSPWHGTTGQAAVVSAWNGGILDSARSRFWLPLGGGHFNYFGNEAYLLDLYADAPEWVMPRPPTGAIGNLGDVDDGLATPDYFDGQPRSTHSYNRHVYVPGVGPVLSIAGNAWSYEYNTYQYTDLFTELLNESTGLWQTVATHPLTGSVNTSSAACYDSLRHCIWWRTTGAVRYYKLDIATWTWTCMSSWQYTFEGDYFWIEHLPEHDRIAQVVLNTGLVLFDPETGTKSTPTISGSAPSGIAFNGASGITWDGTRLLVWHNSSNTTVIGTLTPNNDLSVWTWGSLEFSGVTPTTRDTTGTFGRFRYSKPLGGCILQNTVTTKTYFFALE